LATDPARAKKRTLNEFRQEMQAACRETPCRQVERLLGGKDETPACVVCVHEGRIVKEVKR
jgi:hypothetical protein